jgi:beta-lactamase regulating signal transducer with metallopeptidase domain
VTEILLVLKATALVVVALLFARVSGRRVPAALRAVVLTGTFAALLILPVATFVLPPLPVPMPPRLSALFEPVPSMVFDANALSVDVESGQTSGAGAVAESPRGDRRPAADASALSVVAVVGLVWLAGVLIIGVRLAIGLWTLRRRRRTAVPWPEGAALARHLLGDGVAARTAIVLQPNVDAPVTHGLLRPVVALPPDAPQWPPSYLRRALIHELEHVRRADWATQLLATVVCALYWFHPLVWLAARRLRLAMEQACDDAVVRREEETAYAEQLVGLARRLSGASALESLAMAAGSDLSQRVGALLDPLRARSRVGSAVAAAALVAGLGAGLTGGTIQLEARQSQWRPTFEAAPVGRISVELRAQTFAGTPRELRFEVASVKPSPPKSAPGPGIQTHPGGRLTANRATLRALVLRAFGIKDFQLEGGPD